MSRVLRWACVGLLATVVLLVILALALWPTMPPAPTLEGSLTEGRLEQSGRTRRYEVYEPSSLLPGAPLVFSIHGSGLGPATQREWVGARFAELADERGFLLVYTEGWQLEWNGCRAPGVTEADRLNLDDVGFHLTLIERFRKSHRIDPTRVFAAGFSNGGQMAFRLASDAPERFAAVAVMAANVPEPANSKCNEPRGPIPVLIMNGVSDPIVPFQGGTASLFGLSPRGKVRSAQGSVQFWREVNGAGSVGKRGWLADLDPADSSKVEYQVFGGGRSEVVLYSVHGGGHTIPGGVALGSEELFGGLFGVANRDVHGIDLIWDFFQAHPRDPVGPRPAHYSR